MQKIKYLLVPLLAALVLPTVAQTNLHATAVGDNEPEAVDSTEIDSLKADTLSTLPWPQKIQRELYQLLDSKMFKTSQVGMMVWDLEADSCLFSLNERQTMRPASCMKLVTAITAIDRLGGSYQFKTQLKYTGTIANGVLDGDIYCIGGMDPRFNGDDMTAFVNSMKEMGIDTIRGSIYADKSMKSADPYGEGWCWDDDNPLLSPLLISRKDQFMSRFLTQLREAGIYYGSFGTSERTCPAGAFSIVTRTHSLDQILMRMMKESDNLYAESMYYQIAASAGTRPATARDARYIEQLLIKKIGLDPTRYQLADGSGLSLYNYISAELLTRLLRYAYHNENIMLHLLPALPIAGTDGTLKKRMRNSTAYGQVHAKTGTLTGIISLAGFCRAANGHQLCFAIINQGVLHAGNARAFQDRVCELLTRQP